MKTSFLHALLAIAGCLFVLGAAPVRAGSAVAADDHGGYGYSYGDRSQEQLDQEAIRRCREKSSHPDDVHVVVRTRHGGSGIIVRYHVEGRPHVYAYVGAENDEQAYNYATGYVEGYGGKKIEVVARWKD